MSRLVDIVILVDNSGSMTDEIQALENNINTNFANILGNAGIDYRVILIARHGSAAAAQSICIRAPLSGTNCTPPPAQPVNNVRFFHYSTEISSTNALSRAVATYNTPDEFALAATGWQQWLRPDALKELIIFTDDNSALAAASFDTQLLALSAASFGTAQSRNYVFHSVVGLTAVPITSALPPTAPLATTTCMTAVNTGSAYQNLSMMTGGLRMSVCETASYDVVMQTLAARFLADIGWRCTYPLPPPPAGHTATSPVTLQYTPSGGGAARTLSPVADAAACSMNDTYYLAGSVMTLCPAVCTAVQADPQPRLRAVFGCP